ncbi:MAG: hypothetical protein Q8936_01300 [Bacillota bacterium]|nr:hypothetical protein [Bacillota bacterium]
MKYIFKVVKVVLGTFLSFFLVLFLFIVFAPVHNPNMQNTNLNNSDDIKPFSLSQSDITYYDKSNSSGSNLKNTNTSSTFIKAVLTRAVAMTEVKWIPKYNLIDKKGMFIFIKGKTYYGVPYSMDSYQVRSPDDFLSKINNSDTLYGNDCSGFVSAAWDIPRQTTLSLYNALKNGTKIDGKSIEKESWNELQSADALLLDDGKGNGHIMLYIDCDKKNSDNLNVYEQNIPTIIPFEPIPVARKDIRSKSKLISEGYIPIRLIVNS